MKEFLQRNEGNLEVAAKMLKNLESEQTDRIDEESAGSQEQVIEEFWRATKQMATAQSIQSKSRVYDMLHELTLFILCSTSFSSQRDRVANSQRFFLESLKRMKAS